MPSIRIVSGCVANGAPRAAGDVLTVSDADAAFLINRGSAALYTAPTPVAPPTPPVPTQAEIDADVVAVQVAQAKLLADLKARGE